MPDEFKRTEATPVQSALDLVEKLLGEWKIPPESIKDKERNLWYLVQGTAQFHIELFKFNKGPQIGDVDAIEIGGTIMKLPQDNFLPLYRRLLELNAGAVGCYFAIRNNLVVLLATREVTGLDYAEFKTIVDAIRYWSDYWDEILMQEFGGTK